MNRVRSIILCVVVIALGTGCASTIQYVPFSDQAKQVENPNQARIYVARPTAYGGAISMTVRDGDTVIGKTGPKGYLCWERSPGTIEIVGKAENTARLSLTVEEGAVYYIQQHVRMGILSARNKLRQRTKSEGEAMVGKCKPPKLRR